MRGHGSKRNGSASSTHPKVMFDRYMDLARAAVASEDPVASENYYQHAEHYFRVLNKDAAQR